MFSSFLKLALSLKELHVLFSDKWTMTQLLKSTRSLTPILLKISQKTAEEGKLPRSFYEATITLISKQDKAIEKKKEN